MYDETDFDPLDDLLAAETDISPAPLRQTVFASTRKVLRHRRAMRRVRTITALAACYLAGMVTMNYWRPAVETSTQPERKVIASLEEDLALLAAAGVKSNIPKTKYERLRAEADRAWDQSRDMESALQIYARALKFATPEELKINPDKDNFILATLKEAQFAENDHEISNDHS
jgi:hypothetical protein